MKKQITLLMLIAISIASFAQDAKEIMQKSYSKCQSIKNGYYEVTKYMKYMSGTDTTMAEFKCTFKKLKLDPLFPSAFHYKSIHKDYSMYVMYTGEDFVTYYPSDSSGEIMSKSLWAKDIISRKANYTFYTPFTSKKSSPFPNLKDYTDDKHFFKFIGEEKLNNINCYHIQMNIILDKDDSDEMLFLKDEINFWINKDDSIPVQYTVAIDEIVKNDTMYQYEKYVLNKYELNTLTDESILKLTSIPSFYKLRNFTPEKRPELLTKGTIAPEWSLISTKDEKISLKDLKGKIVLIDFFYKSCYPCMQALPALQNLHEKYKDKGLIIIGIDPYDKKEDDIANFLSKRGVTYPILLGGIDAATTYRVSAYPTLYLIDKTGKIIFTQTGYGKGVEEKLEEIIKKNL